MLRHLCRSGVHALRASVPRATSGRVPARAIATIVPGYAKLARFRFGHFQGVLGPGLRWDVPVVHQSRTVDTRDLVTPLPEQRIMTHDNIPVTVHAQLSVRVDDVERYVMNVMDGDAVEMVSTTLLQAELCKHTLNAILRGRSKLSETVREQAHAECQEWGVAVNFVRLVDIHVEADMERALAKIAEAERDRDASVIRAEGELESVTKLAEAATTLASVPQAFALRELQTLERISKEEGGHTVIVPAGFSNLANMAARGQSR